MKSKLTTAIFLNHCFDKRRFQSFLYWFFKKSHSGQWRLLNFLEKLKFLGFHSATQAGFSISIDDLKIPFPKSPILSAAENIVFNADLHLISGHLTTIERYQRIIEIWNRTSEKLKYQVLQSFQISDFLNPVYLMAFSGARGNISQIRQLVGMRGLMADPQGKIIDFPIRSNFREGLTLTEYLISCSGARKGIVDTALRTAASGYLTRRLVDVAHHVIISQIDCQQVLKPKGQGALTQTLVDFSKTSQCGIWIEALYDQQKEILPLQQRLVGRILAETITFPEKSLVIGLKDQEISQITSQKICKYRKKVLIRSPLTCQSSKFICQLCYGWNLSEGQLVSVGEAVGVLAAQSIGEPGTQLTMRTFHTGGVFTGRLIDQTYAPFFGTAYYNSFCNGLLIRTVHGRIAYLSKNNGILSIHQSKKRAANRAQPSGMPVTVGKAVPWDGQHLARFGPGPQIGPWAVRCSYFILEKLRFTFDQVHDLNPSLFKVKFELKPIYSNFVLDSMTDFKAKNKRYFQKIKHHPLASRSDVNNNGAMQSQVFPSNYNAITRFSNQTSPRYFRDTLDDGGSSYSILSHSQAFLYQFKKLSCQLKGMIALNQTWLNLRVSQDCFRPLGRNILGRWPEGKGKVSLNFSSNKKNQKYKFTNTCRFNLNFIFNISQIYQLPSLKRWQAAKKMGWSAFPSLPKARPLVFRGIHNKGANHFSAAKDHPQSSFEKQIQFVFQIFTLLYVRQGENVLKTQLIAELPFFENEQSLENEQEVLSNESGEIYFENFVFLEKTRLNLKTGSEITKIIKDYVQGLGEFWILFGRPFQHLLTTQKLSFFRKFDLLDGSMPFAQIKIEPHNFLNIETSDLVLQKNFRQIEQINLLSRRKKIPLSKIQNLQYDNFSTTHLIFKPGLWSLSTEGTSGSLGLALQTSFHQQSGFFAFNPVNKHCIKASLPTAHPQYRRGYHKGTRTGSKIKTLFHRPLGIPRDTTNNGAMPILQKFSRTFQIHLIFFKNSGYLQIPSSNLQALSIGKRHAQSNAFTYNPIRAFVQNCNFLLLNRISKNINLSFLNQNLIQSKILNGTYSSPQSTGFSNLSSRIPNAIFSNLWICHPPLAPEGKGKASRLKDLSPFNLAKANSAEEFHAVQQSLRQTDSGELNKNCVDKIFWKDRKNYQKLLNKNFATWMIGLQRQSKYIPKYSDFRQQFFKISRKHFYLQFLKNSQSNFHPIQLSFLNLQKQKRNFFFSDTSFLIQKNSQKFFCEFQNQTLILSPLRLCCTSWNSWVAQGIPWDKITGRCLWTQEKNQIDLPKSEFKKINRIKLPFFFHENTCILLVNRQGISQFFGQEIIQNSATFNSISPYGSSLCDEAISKARQIQSIIPQNVLAPLFSGSPGRALGSDVQRILHLTSKYINFHALFLNLQVFGFCKVSFRIGTKKCWKVPKISKNQLPKFWHRKAMFAKKKLNIYHWFSNSIQQSSHLWHRFPLALPLYGWPILQFFKGSTALRSAQPQENIQSVFCTLFLKQSKLFQNLPKNWTRQITNVQSKIIHWNDLPYQKYIFLISFLQELAVHNVDATGDFYKFIQPKNLKTVTGSKIQNYRKILPFQNWIDFRIGFSLSKKFYLKNFNNFDWKIQFWKIQQRQDIMNFPKWKIGVYSFIRIFFCILASESKGKASSFKSIQWVKRLEPNWPCRAGGCQTSKLSLIFDPGVKTASRRDGLSCFKNFFNKPLPCSSHVYWSTNRLPSVGGRTWDRITGPLGSPVRFSLATYLWPPMQPNGRLSKHLTVLQLNLTKLFLKNRFRQHSAPYSSSPEGTSGMVSPAIEQQGKQYQYSLFRQRISQKFLFNKEKLSSLTSRSVNPKNWTLFSNFFVPKQTNEKLISISPRYFIPGNTLGDGDKMLSTIQTGSPKVPLAGRELTEIKHTDTESKAGEKIIMNRLEKLATPRMAKRGFSIYTGLWGSKFIDFRSSFPGDKKLKNNFQNIHLGSPNAILEQYHPNPGNQFDISYQWKFFGDCVTIMEQKLYPTYFQNFSLIENYLNRKRDRVFQKRIEDLQNSMASAVDFKTQNRGAIYPSLDKVLKNFFQTSTTNDWLDEISGTRASVFLLDKILPKSLFSLESGIFKNRILPFYNQIESSKLQKYILDFYFGSYCHILQNFSLFKNFTSRFSQNQPKKPIYNMFSVIMLVDTIEKFLSTYNDKIQKTGSKIQEDIMRKVTSPSIGQLQPEIGASRPGFRPKFKNSNQPMADKGPTSSQSPGNHDLPEVPLVDNKGTWVHGENWTMPRSDRPTDRLYRFMMPTHRKRGASRVRIEQFDQCLKTKFHNLGRSKKQIQSPLNQRYPDPPIGELKPVVYQIPIGSNNKNELNKIFNDIFGSNYSIPPAIEKNTLNLQKSDIQHFFESWHREAMTTTNNFYIEYISKKSSRFKDDFSQIQNFHKLNMKSWLNRTKNFQKYSIRYLKSKLISKKLNLYIKNFGPVTHWLSQSKAHGVNIGKGCQDLFYKKILNKTLFLIQQQENPQIGQPSLSKARPLPSPTAPGGGGQQRGNANKGAICCFILKFSKKNWNKNYPNFYSIYLSHHFFSIQTSTKCQNRKFFRIPLILHPKQRTYNQKNITLNNFFPSKLQYRSKINFQIFKLQFKILSIIQALLFVYSSEGNYTIPLSRSAQNIPRLTLRSRILTELKTKFSRGSYLHREAQGSNSALRGADRQSFPRTTLEKEYFNSFDISFLFPSHLKFPIVYIPLFDQSHEIFLTSIIPLTLNFHARPAVGWTRLDSKKAMQYKTSISDVIPKIWDQTHFLKIHIIQTKRLDFLNSKAKTQFQYWLNPKNKDVCNYQIIKKNDLKSFEIQIFIRFFFPFHLGEIVDLSQKTKSLLLTNIEDFFSYHNHWPIDWTDLNVQNYKPPVFLDEFFNLFYLQPKNKRLHQMDTFTVKNKSILVSIFDPVSKVQLIPRHSSPTEGTSGTVSLAIEQRGMVQSPIGSTYAPHRRDGGKLERRSKIDLFLYPEAQRLVKLDLKIQLFQKPNNILLNQHYLKTKQLCFAQKIVNASSKLLLIKKRFLASQRHWEGIGEVLSTPILINKHLRPSFQKNIVPVVGGQGLSPPGHPDGHGTRQGEPGGKAQGIPRDKITGRCQSKSSLLGSLMRGGQEFTAHQFSFHAGQLIAKTGHIFLYRKATTHLLNNQSILHVQHGEIISKNQRLCSVFYSQSKTGDIVQGIPKIEEIFEARKKSKYSLHELPIFSKDFLFFEKKIAKYLQSLQKSVVNSIQRIYCGQGIHISDKHIEIIVRQMTSNVVILEPGQTGLLCGEIVALHWVRRTNSLFTSNQVIYEPIFLGMTKTCLETSSFLSAASFQETTRILSRAALQNQIDFIRGLKQNVILGNLIPIGTGYFK